MRVSLAQVEGTNATESQCVGGSGKELERRFLRIANYIRKGWLSAPMTRRTEKSAYMRYNMRYQVKPYLRVASENFVFLAILKHNIDDIQDVGMWSGGRCMVSNSN